MTLTLSHGGDTIFTSAVPSTEVLVGTKDGVARIQKDQQGANWHIADQWLTDKHIHAVIIEPVSSTIFVGATEDSLYASQDNGRTWERRDKGLTHHDIYSLASAQVDGRTRIFLGTQPAHLFYSDDLGRNWSEFEQFRSVDMSGWTFPAPPHIAHTKHINFHPGDINTLFISVEVGGLVKSTDGGNTFKLVPGMDSDVHRTAINPLDPDRIYITGGNGTYVTSDGGDSWEHWTTTEHEIGGYPDFLLIHPKNPNVVFVAAAENGPGSWREHRYAGSRISKSTDGGLNWTALRNGLPDRLTTAFEAMILEDWGESFSIFGATATGEIWATEDGGEHWSEIITGMAPVSKGGHYEMLMPA